MQQRIKNLKKENKMSNTKKLTKTIALLLDLKVELSKIKIICNKTDYKE